MRGTHIRIVLIRPWTRPLAPVRQALRSAGMAARIVRVDFEPALNAALGRDRCDVVVLDEGTEITRTIALAHVREHGSMAPVISLGALDDLAAAIIRALATTVN